MLKSAALLTAAIASWVAITAATAPQPIEGQAHPTVSAATCLTAFGAMRFNPCATLDTSNVGDLRTPCSVYAADGTGTVATVPGTREWARCVGAAAMYTDGSDVHPGYTDAKGTAWAWVSDEAGYEPAGAN